MDIDAVLGDRTADLIALSHRLHAHPEVAFEEHQSAAHVLGLLSAHGGIGELGLAGLPTAFAARFGRGPLHVALFAEYDALPAIGHACGHNLIAAAAVGAAIALAPLVDDLGLTVTVFGTPAEEQGAGKVLLLERGAFAGQHAGLMIHPGPFDAPAPQTSALSRLAVTASGRAAHAGGAAHLGVNAADALVLAQAAIGLLRQQLRPGDQVHGVVTSAGTAANVIPDRATADYMVRAPSIERLDAVEARVRDCFAAGALATGARVDVLAAQPRLRQLTSDPAMLARWSAHHRALGHRPRPGPPVPISTDLGNLSAVLPCIHPIVGIGSWPAVNHQPGFAAATVTPAADRALIDAATTLARTVVDLATDPDLRARLIERPSAESPGSPHLTSSVLPPLKSSVMSQP